MRNRFDAVVIFTLAAFNFGPSVAVALGIKQATNGVRDSLGVSNV
jgi:hypothetical protein